MFVLAGLAIIVLGFWFGINPLAVVVAAGITMGLAAGFGPVATIAALGKAFTASRYVSVIWLVLPVIGLLERHGLQERARAVIAGFGAATPGRLFGVYFIFRQATAAVGLIAIAGQAQTVRPLLVPMAEAAAGLTRPLSPRGQARLRAMAAATDNIAVFFAEDIFVAIASILLIKAFLEANGIIVSPFSVSMWAIPTAIVALLIHVFRLWRFDVWLKKA